MSSPSFGFASWRRRAPSIDSELSTEDALHRTTSPPQSQQPVADARLLSSSTTSTAGYREPIRSFIHGSFRSHLGTSIPNYGLAGLALR